MKTCTFIFWIYLLVLFPHGLFSKSSTNKEQYSSDSKNSNENSEIDAENEDVALHESFRPRHKYKANGHQTRVYRSDSENSKDPDSKAAQCAVMYKDNEPVGILQPFKESYRFLPVSGDPTLVDLNPIPVKRKTFMDVLYPNKMNEDYNEETGDNTNQFADDRYPSIFAKFKIDSRLDRNLNPDLNMKRSMFKRDTERPDISEEQANSLKTKMKGDNSAVVEEELKNILDDMGLIDDYDDNKEEAKREVEEDENMEQGTNKINLIKEAHNETRNKRAEGNGTTDDQTSTTAMATTTETITSNATTTTPATTTPATTTPATTATVAVAVPTKARFEEERTEEVDSIDLFKDGDAKINDDSEKEDLEVSTEAESEDSRRKRQFEEKDAKDGNNKDDKRDATDDLPDINVNSSTLVKQAELTQYETRVEREIRDRIQKLKEEVKEEIKNLKGNPQVKSTESDARRKKRQVTNTLIDEETPNIDPNLNDENPDEEHHVRRKRNLISDDSSTANDYVINNNTIHPSNLNDKLNQKYQMIDESNNGLRFVINFGNIDPKIKKEVEYKSMDEENKQYMNKNRKTNGKDVVNVAYETNNFYRTSGMKDNEKVTNIEPYVSSLSDNYSNTATVTDIDIVSNPRNIVNNATHNVSCRHSSYSICHRCNKNINDMHTKNRNKRLKTLKTKREGKVKKWRRNVSNNLNNEQNVSFGELNRKANIINILSVIGEKKNVKINSDNDSGKENGSCVNCQIIRSNASLSKTNESQRFVGKLKPANEIGYDEDTLKRLQRNSTLKLYNEIREDAENTKRRKRFVGINPVLENTTNYTDHHLSRSLKQYDENIKTNLESYDDNMVAEIENIGKMRRYVGTNPFLENTANITNYEYYQGRNLKQFDEDATKTNSESGSHARVKKSIGGEDSRTNIRKKRQASDDSVENTYQYDNPEFNEEAVDENQSYYDQPYANDNNVAGDTFTSNAKSNCNCDKTGGGCKCGTQRTELNVPNVNQEYSDYAGNPRGPIEKKAASHCNCDKNGKHCKCQTFGEDTQYSDYAEEQSGDVEGKPASLDEDAASGEVRDGPRGERVPRRSRQRRRNARRSMEDSDREQLLAEDYYENYETGGGNVMKREVRPRKLAANQQFQNGEYFVDLHPDVYRLTPVESSRKKRDSFKDLVAIHGGGPVVNHLVAIRQRSMLPHPRIRRRAQNEDNGEPRQLIDMSDEDLFGALPQSFAGELARYKRVKRGKAEE